MKNIFLKFNSPDILLLLLLSGADPEFFLGGGALVSCSTSTPINHIVFLNTSCMRKPQVRGGGGARARTPCTLPLDPPLIIIIFTSTATIILWEEDICEFAFRSFWKKCLEVAEYHRETHFQCVFTKNAVARVCVISELFVSITIALLSSPSTYGISVVNC